MREVTVATPTDRVSAEVAVSLLRAMKIPARMVSSIEPAWTIGSISGSLADLRVLERFPRGVPHESFDGVGTGLRSRRPGVRQVLCLLWRDILAGL